MFRSDAGARVWDARTGGLLYVVRHDDDLSDIVFTPDGKRLITAGLDGTARIWDAASGELLGVVTHDDQVFDLDISPDGTWLITGADDFTARLHPVTFEAVLE